MAVSLEERQRRVRQGSRRRRDLEAAGVDERREREERVRPKTQATPAASAAWDATQERLARSFSVPTFGLWIAPITCDGEFERALVLAAPRGIHAWAERRYGKLIGEAVRAATDYRGAYLFVARTGEQEADGCL